MMHKPRFPTCARTPAILMLILRFATAAAAQEPQAAPAELPREVAAGVVAFYNAASTIRVEGDARVPAGRVVDGNLAVLGGTLNLAGTVRGDVVVINGELRLAQGARVDGAVTVVGGEVFGAAEASIGGPTAVYPAGLRYRREGDAIVAVIGHGAAELAAGREFGFGRTDLVLAVWRGYNRVEGLPIAFGPRFELGHRNPTVLSARGIYRTGDGFRLDKESFGYTARIEQAVGGRGDLRLTAGIHSEVATIEPNGLSDRENSLATFLFHRDFRDHYRRKGWTVGVTLAPPRASGALGLEFRDERNEAVQPVSPWSLIDNDQAWRAEPAIAEGRLQSLALRYTVDTRNEPEAPSTGWFISTELEAGLGGSIALPRGLSGFDLQALETRHFHAGLLDLRRYARLGPESRLATRVRLAGSIDGDPLPPQRQRVLGGEGNLPAYNLMEFDCGAREAIVELGTDSIFPYYGCDRSVLVQLEYEARLPVAGLLGGFFGPSVDLSNAASWVVFFDAGRAWIESDARHGRGGGQGDFAGDAGVGIRFGRLGVYWAVPLTGGDQKPNFFVRIEPRL